MRNNNTNKMELWLQAQAFLDYSSRLQIQSRDDLLETFHHWADSKDFPEEDARRIQNLVEQHWEEKEKQMAESKHQKRRGKKKFIDTDKRQLQFEFVDSPSNENGKEKEETA